jgi:hypothetical protein
MTQAEMGVIPSKSKLYRARQLVLGELDVDYEEKYQLVGPLLDAYAAMNPGSIARMERDSNNRFFRCVFMEGDSVFKVKANYLVTDVVGWHGR